MAKTNGQINVSDGPFYEVNFAWIPRVGEIIDLQSFVDAAAGHDARHLFKVVKVIHRMSDVTKKSKLSPQGTHHVEVYVKRTRGEYTG